MASIATATSSSVSSFTANCGASPKIEISAAEPKRSRKWMSTWPVWPLRPSASAPMPPRATLVPAGVTARFQAISARRCAIFTVAL